MWAGYPSEGREGTCPERRAVAGRQAARSSFSPAGATWMVESKGWRHSRRRNITIGPKRDQRRDPEHLDPLSADAAMIEASMIREGKRSKSGLWMSGADGT